MTEQIAVVVEQAAVEDAYEMGYDRFEGQELDAEVADEWDYSYFTETATYSNIVQPALRAIAGYGDSGTGTYTENRTIVLVDAADLDDEPTVGDEYNAKDFSQVLYDRFADGARDAVAGREKGDSL